MKKKDIQFGDYIMQTQYENLRKDGLTKRQAKNKVMEAHREYYGESAKFYGL